MHEDRSIGIERPPEEFDIQTSVTVIGAGACGLTAAARCAQEGVDTIIFERDVRPFGSTGMSYGSVCGAGTKLQAREGINDSADALAEDIITITKGETDADHASAIGQNARQALDWLIEDLGLELTIEKNWAGYGHRVARLHATPSRSGEELVTMLSNAAEDAGATLVTQADVTTLFVDNQSGICGVGYNSPDGKVTIGCDAVILASSGFAANTQMVKKEISDMSNATYYGAEGSNGDAVFWANCLGLQLADMGAYQALGNLAIPHNIVIPHTVLIDGGFAINSDGDRFHNELENISGQALTILEQTGEFCWLIYDEKGHSKALSLFEEYRRGDEVSAYKFDDSIEGLAAQIKISAQALESVIADISALSKNGRLDQFGRQFEKSNNLQPPYYAVKVTGALFHTQGGICVDQTARVKKTDNSVVSNLFAGGGAIRSVSGPAEWGYLPGMGLCTAIAFGWRAGLEAAKLTKYNS